MISATAPWHQALAFALTGERFEGLGRQGRPQVSAALEEIDRLVPGGVDAVRTSAARVLASGESWPYPLPDDLRSEVGAAQFHALLARALAQLDVHPGQRVVPPASHRLPNADERRLLQEVPPHHGV